MYEAHFSLKKRPFGSKAEGASVFVGPQQANIMTSLKKGLIATDAIVTVTGPVGVGKTTIVSRALESISPGRMVAWVGRMQLASDELLELLLAGFGVGRQAKGSIRRFAAFRRLLNERAAAGAQVAIVVEDAMRIGPDALVELEALTAADTGDSASANIVLMGPPGLNKLLATPELARIHQRNRLRQTIDPFSATEVQGYLKHCIREAGGDYAAIFDNDVVDIVYRCSEGIPRVINTLCETALSSAAETNVGRVSAALIRQVAADAFGFEPDLVAVAAPFESAQVATGANTEQAIPAEIPNPVVATEIQTPPVNTPETTPDNIAELINDTNPELKRLDADSFAATAATEFDIESTQTQKRPVAFATDESENNEPDFDLDQAISPETDATNIMPGLTPNLDQLAAGSRMREPKKEKPEQAADNEAVYEATENLPTLSDSMRVDVEVEVERAKKSLASDTAALAEPVVKHESELLASAVTDQESEPAPATKLETEQGQEPEAAKEPEPEVIAATESEPETEAAAPQAVAEPEPESEPEPELEPEPVAALKIETEPAAKNAPDADAPAELALEPESPPEPVTATATASQAKGKKTKRIPDIAALEAALESAKKGDFALQPGSAPVANLKPAEKIATADPVTKIENAADVPVTDIPEITLDDALPQEKAEDANLEKCAAEIGRASSLEDISDFAAETIFGNEAFDEIAAAVTTNPPSEEPSPVLLQDSEISVAANDTVAAKPAVESSPKATAAEVDLDSSAKSQLAMVNALNNGIPTVATPKSETIEMGEDKPAAIAQAKPTGPQPEPIENQFNTSMTQTLKALSSAKATQTNTVEEDEKPSGGLFSRFRR